MMIPGLLGTLSGGFKPTDIGGCVLWLDASQVSGFNNNDPMAQWNDLSGQGNHVTQSEEAAKPKFATSGINSHPAILFNGTSTYLAASSNITVGSMLFVAKYYTALFDQYATTVGSTTDIICMGHAGTNHWYQDTLTNARKDGAAITWSQDGSGPMSAASIYYGEISLTTTIQISRDRAIGRFWDGWISEVVIYSGALSIGNVFALEQYLASKWGITIDQSPVNTVAPAITGDSGWTTVSTATCSTGTWTNSPTSYAYQWQWKDDFNEIPWTDITGETTNTLLLTFQALHQVRCRVIASNAFATSVAAYSNTSDLIV